MLQGAGGKLRAKIVESAEHQIAKVVFYSNTGKRWPEMETLLLELDADPSTATGADKTISDWTIDDPVVPDVR